MPCKAIEARRLKTPRARYKVILGSGLRVRTVLAQNPDIEVGYSVLNRMNSRGMPASQRIH